MARVRLVYQCERCGARSPKWSGQCPECREWNTMHEAALAPLDRSGGPGSRGSDGPSRIESALSVEVGVQRHLSTGMGELDRVLGGGLVAGGVVLIGGDPGIGKSTLLLQVTAGIACDGKAAPLYVTGEESLPQVVMRGRRLGVPLEGVRLLAETRMERIIELASPAPPAVLVIDSIQTMHCDGTPAAPGSVSQVRECGAGLTRFAKSTGSALLLVGHVTKEGSIAGPRVLEHLVDTVLYFEPEGNQRYRILRAVKNRFGAANELGIFAMGTGGLREVPNPSAIFLSRRSEAVSGSVVTVTREGTRPLMVELQALVDGESAGSPRRVSLGLDPIRLSMLLAVLSRHAGTPTQTRDVFVNVVGGVRISETAADLPVLAAVFSSLRNRPVPKDLVAFGEVGLAGEIRPVYNGEERLQIAVKHGFKRAVVPRANRLRDLPPAMEVTQVRRLDEALERLFLAS